MGMSIRRETAVALIGEERMAKCLGCVADAWRTYEEHFRPHLPLCHPNHLPTFLHELVCEEVRRHLTEDLGFVIHDGVAGGRFLVEVDGRVILQFRKLTRDMLTRNNPTDTSDAFDRQESGIDGIPDQPRLTVGYQLGQYRTSIAATYLAFVVGRECVWFHDLETGEHSTTIEFPQPGESAAERETRDEERRKVEREDPDEMQRGR